MATTWTNDDTLKFGGMAVVVVAAIGWVALNIIWGGYVFAIIWGWFFVPLLGAPPLGIAAAIGIRATVFFAAGATYVGPDDRSNWRKLTDMAFRPLVVLAILWIVKGFL